MAKRSRAELSDDDFQEGQLERSTKRSKLSAADRLSGLSDELLLRVLSYLPLSQLVVCQRLSHKYEKLAGDGQLWKSHYYNRFVRPRASRLPGLKDFGTFNESLHFASKTSRWLDEEALVKNSGQTNWKKQYRLRHNWSRGSCAVNEISVAEHAAIPPTLVQMHDGVIYTADHTDGVRAWSAKGSRAMIAQLSLASSEDAIPPTSIAVDSNTTAEHTARVMVGFQDGSFNLYLLSRPRGAFMLLYRHPPSSNGVVSAVALAWPYALTMTATQMLSLYRFKDQPSNRDQDTILSPPRLLHSLKSHTVWPPLSASLRQSSTVVVICVAYTLPTYLSGWTVGLQEVKINLDGSLQDSRLASAIDQHYRPLAFSTRPITHHLMPFLPNAGPSPALELRHIHSKPTSLSYTHPYLLVSHPDNTLTLYLVTSTADTLSISAGSRLWGHTSAVSGAHIGGRGKAVSVSRRGDELRVWELEGGFTSSAARKKLATGDLSVQVKPGSGALNISRQPQSGLDLANGADGAHTGPDDDTDEQSELTITRGWIGFDDENVVVLKEQNQGKQTLVVYDFT